MKILIVVPKYTSGKKSLKPNYNYSFPIGLSYIYSIIKKEGYDIEAYNLNHEEGKIDYLIKRKLDREKYDVVCTGGMAIDYEIIEKIINSCKSHLSNPLIILGGAIITSNKKLISKNMNFDIGVIGEGEKTIIEVLKKIDDKKSLDDVKGICYRKNDKIKFTPPREPILDLDSLPFPDYDALGFGKVLDKLSSLDALFGCGGMDYPRTYPILGSRGCPFQCTFCYHSLGPRYRTRSLKNILEEIEYAIKKHNINSLHLHDDLFSLDKKRLDEFCIGIKKLSKKYSIKLAWICQLWVGVVDKNIIRKLKDSGCVVASFGFESYSPVVLKSMKKPITPEQIDNAIKTCLSENMTFIGNFIFGDLAETKETAKETLEYWKNNCKGQVKLFFIHPYPGSEIYESCLKRGIIKDELDFIKNGIHHTNIRNMTENMSDEEFEWLKKEVYKLSKIGFGHIIPYKIKKENERKYEISVVCPHCKKSNIMKNCLILNTRYYSASVVCRHCGMRFNISNKLYKFTADNYVMLDFLRKNYLKIRDKILRSRM